MYSRFIWKPLVVICAVYLIPNLSVVYKQMLSHRHRLTETEFSRLHFLNGSITYLILLAFFSSNNKYTQRFVMKYGLLIVTISYLFVLCFLGPSSESKVLCMAHYVGFWVFHQLGKDLIRVAFFSFYVKFSPKGMESMAFAFLASLINLCGDLQRDVSRLEAVVLDVKAGSYSNMFYGVVFSILSTLVLSFYFNDLVGRRY